MTENFPDLAESAVLSPFPERYERAINLVVAVCREVSSTHLGIVLPRLQLAYAEVAADAECIRTDYRSVIYFELESPARFRPPPHGVRCIYATCHEIGHMVVARCLAGRGLPPVIWDEALAHFLAVRLFVPAVWASHGAELWPDPYPDYGIAEGCGSLGEGPQGHLGDYEASLRMLEGRLSRLVGDADWCHLVRALADVERRDLGVLRFWPALQRSYRLTLESQS